MTKRKQTTKNDYIRVHINGQLKKLQLEVAKGLASFNHGKTYDIDEVKALFAKSGE